MKNDIGKSKVEQAKINIAFHTPSAKTEVEVIHGDVLEHWPKIVEWAKSSTVVFNMVDVGDYFDAAVGSLCMKLGLPLIQGGTFAQTYSVDYFPVPAKDTSWACLGCSNHMLEKEHVEKLLPSKILEVDTLTWLPKNDNPVGQSNCYLCVIAAEMMVARYGSHLIADPDIKLYNRALCSVNSFEIDQYNIEKEPECLFCNDMGI